MLDQTNEQKVSNDQDVSGLMTTKSSAKTKTVNIVITGKGGVGKSVVASFLTQYFVEMGAPIIAVDIDPVQTSLANITGLTVTETLDLLDSNDRINVPVMDAFITRIIEEDKNFVLDCGAAGFVAFLSYVLKDRLFDLVIDEGKRVVIHAVVCGGPQMVDTILSLGDMIKQLPQRVEFVVWQNPYFGPLQTSDGRTFEGSPWWEANKTRVSSTVRIPDADPHYTGAAVKRMLSDRITFANALTGNDFDRIARLRLRRFWDETKSQIWAAV